MAIAFLLVKKTIFPCFGLQFYVRVTSFLVSVLLLMYRVGLVVCSKLFLTFTWELHHVTKLWQAVQHSYQNQQKFVADH